MIINYLRRFLFLVIVSLALFFAVCFCIQWSSLNNQDKDHDSYAPKSGRFIDIGQESIFIQETGKKNKFGYVFIHGTGSWSELWIPSMKLLEAKGLYSVAIDLSPFGFSYSGLKDDNVYDRKKQAQKIVAIVKKLGISKVHLVGHSFGGRATLTAALMMPESIKGLTLVNIALGFGKDKDTLPSTPDKQVKTVIRNDFLRNTIVALGTMPFLTRKLVSGFVANESSITPEIEWIYKRPLRIKGKNAQISDWLKVFLLSEDNELLENKDQFKKLMIPVSIIWGELDTVTPPWQGIEIKSMFPNASLTILKDVGHIPIIESAGEFNKALIQGAPEWVSKEVTN